MIKIKNQDLVDVITFLEGFELTPKVSRVRTKLVKLIREKIDELYKDEVDLLQRFGKKDEEGNLVQDNGNFSLLPETASEYHKEKATQEVGKEYGLGLEEMEEVAREIWNV